MNPSNASFDLDRPIRGTVARRGAGGALQQQQRQVSPVRRMQQQQGSTDFQPVSQEGDSLNPARPVPPRVPAKPGAAKTGGHGGTPVGRLKNGTDTPGETKSYIDEASMNVDA